MKSSLFHQIDKHNCDYKTDLLPPVSRLILHACPGTRPACPDDLSMSSSDNIMIEVETNVNRGIQFFYHFI